jgi:hypothetical protein
MNYQLWQILTITPGTGEAIVAAMRMGRTGGTGVNPVDQAPAVIEPPAAEATEAPTVELLKKASKEREAVSNGVDAEDLEEFDEEL